MNEWMNGSWGAYLASPADFAGADDIITNLAKEREPGIEIVECTLHSLWLLLVYCITEHNTHPLSLCQLSERQSHSAGVWWTIWKLPCVEHRTDTVLSSSWFYGWAGSCNKWVTLQSVYSLLICIIIHEWNTGDNLVSLLFWEKGEGVGRGVAQCWTINLPVVACLLLGIKVQTSTSYFLLVS